MAASLIELDGARCRSAVVAVGPGGPWIADVVLEAPNDVSGRVTLSIGGGTLSGTVDAQHSGTFLTNSHVRLVAGEGAWSRVLPPRAYHHDAGVAVKSVLESTAAAVGEALSVESTKRLAVDFVRGAGPASAVLNWLAPGWYVDYDGVTQVTERAASVPSTKAEIKNFDPRTMLVEFDVDTLTDVLVGAVITDARLPGGSLVVRALDVGATDSLRIFAWLA